MKKYIVLIIILLLMGSFSFAEQGVNIELNDEVLNLTPEAKIINGRAMIPVRGVFENAGLEVEWNGELREVYVISEDKKVTLAIDSDLMYYSGVQAKLDVAPQIINGSTYVPIRAIMEALDVEVGWDAKTSTVILRKGNREENRVLTEQDKVYRDMVYKVSKAKVERFTINVDMDDKSYYSIVSKRIDDSIVHKIEVRLEFSDGSSAYLGDFYWSLKRDNIITFGEGVYEDFLFFKSIDPTRVNIYKIEDILIDGYIDLLKVAKEIKKPIIDSNGSKFYQADKKKILANTPDNLIVDSEWSQIRISPGRKDMFQSKGTITIMKGLIKAEKDYFIEIGY